MTEEDAGYTLVELVVVIFIFTVVMALISASFNKIVSSSGQIVKSAETDIGGLIGLEVLRSDLELAGFGLPWSLPAGFSYSEASAGVQVTGCQDGCPNADAARFNDAPGAPFAPGDNVPRAIVVGNNVGFNGSDYLVLKGTALAMNTTSRCWSYLNYSSSGAVIKPSKSEVELTPGNGDRTIVLKNGVTAGAASRALVTDSNGNGNAFTLVFDTPLSSGFLPKSRLDNYLVYGVAPSPSSNSTANSSALTFPFNRSDYFISRTSDSISPTCAPNTGVLYKMTINQDSSVTKYPLLDCVADMQVILYMDTDGDGKVDYHPDPTDNTFSASDLRQQLLEVRVYILAQEGKKDQGYTYPLDQLPIVVGDPTLTSTVNLVQSWDQTKMRTTFGSDWLHYHWKLYTIVVHPKNMQ